MQEISRDPNKANCHFQTNNTRMLRIESSDKKTCTLTVNQDLRTMIMIQFDKNQNPKSSTKTFRGDLNIRIAAIPQDVEHMACHEIMSNAFFSLELENAFVEIIDEDDK